MNLLRPLTLNLAIAQSLILQNTRPHPSVSAHSTAIKRGYAGLRSAVYSIGHSTASEYPQAIPNTPSESDHLAAAVGEMCNLLVPYALSDQNQSPEQVATLGEYFGKILGGDPRKLRGIVSQSDTHTQPSPPNPDVHLGLTPENSGPVTAATRLVKGLIAAANLHGAASVTTHETTHETTPPVELKGLISKIDNNCVSLLKSLFAECLTLQKRGLSTELKPLLEALEQEEALRGLS